MSRRAWLLATATAVVAGLAVVVVDPARADDACLQQQPLFAVVAGSGHLVEVAGCLSTPGFGPAIEVDAGDWRGNRHLFGARDATSVVLYTITTDGALWSRRQVGPGAGFEAPVRVGASVDWSRFDSVFVAGAGYLHTTEPAGPVRTFRHVDWSTGGAEVVEERSLLKHAVGPPMTAATWTWAGEANVGRIHFRIWRNRGYPTAADHDDWVFESGELPSGVTGVVGSEAGLYGIDAAGDVVRLTQEPTQCPRFNRHPWSVAARSSGGYSRLAVPTPPAPTSVPPSIAPLPSGGVGASCGPPVEWQ